MKNKANLLFLGGYAEAVVSIKSVTAYRIASIINLLLILSKLDIRQAFL
jgi:hypothetical protein